MTLPDDLRHYRAPADLAASLRLIADALAWLAVLAVAIAVLYWAP